MPASLKVVLVVNVLSAAAILVAAVAIGGGFASGSYSQEEGHEIKLVPIIPDDHFYPRPVTLTSASRDTRRLEIPPEYRASDPTPPSWMVTSDAAVRLLSND